MALASDTGPSVDPITLEVVTEGFVAIVKEIRAHDGANR